MRRLLSLLILCLVFPASAQAIEYDFPTNKPIYTKSITDSLIVAQKYWKRPLPCPVQVYVGETDGSWEALTERVLHPCAIWIDRTFLAQHYPRANNYQHSLDICADIIHEYGHLLGYQHVDDPRSIMFYKNKRRTYTVHQCWTRFVLRDYRRSDADYYWPRKWIVG